jgi:hypothetical protein
MCALIYFPLTYFIKVIFAMVSYFKNSKSWKNAFLVVFPSLKIMGVTTRGINLIVTSSTQKPHLAILNFEILYQQ